MRETLVETVGKALDVVTVPTTREASSVTAVTVLWPNTYETRCGVSNPPVAGSKLVRHADFDRPRGFCRAL
jgi:hypothetical protein